MGSETPPTAEGSAQAPVEYALLPEHEVARQFLKMERHHHAMRASGSLHAADVRLLWMLTSSGPMTLKELSDGLRLEQSTVNRQVNAAIRNGLLHRFDDGRAAKVVAPTERGREIFRRDSAISSRVYRGALASLGDDAETFVELLGRFTAGAESTINTLS